MRPISVTVTLVAILATFACKKENLADNPSSKLQGSWRLIQTVSGKHLNLVDSSALNTITFNGNTMLTYRHDTLVNRESFLMAFKADRLPYLVSDKDPWNPRIYSCTFCTSADTLYLSAVHIADGIKATYVRVKNKGAL
ncbi:hypothetical protein [Chitinophaga sp. LS1]|uniref:hypothetical protein n=1 Tax=Chitinophaga sp. LS1 TaxID=3051176 RepID=UPI002AAB2888|nr:hypothetical protein [Chitinophaga sp. LS1]WPV67495.1 hypothetical protein QQL36_01990 [Chitinophaga sp. LS1]